MRRLTALVSEAKGESYRDLSRFFRSVHSTDVGAIADDFNPQRGYSAETEQDTGCIFYSHGSHWKWWFVKITDCFCHETRYWPTFDLKTLDSDWLHCHRLPVASINRGSLIIPDHNRGPRSSFNSNSHLFVFSLRSNQHVNQSPWTFDTMW